MSVISVNMDTWKTEVLDYDDIVIVDVFAPWCQPCNRISPVIDKLATELTEFKFVKLDVDNAPEMGSLLKIQSLPTLLAMKKGKEISRHVGSSTESTIRDWIRSNKRYVILTKSGVNFNEVISNIESQGFRIIDRHEVVGVIIAAGCQADSLKEINGIERVDPVKFD